MYWWRMDNELLDAFDPEPKERWWKFWPIAASVNSSSAVVLGRAVYGGGKRPIIGWLHRNVARRLRNAQWWVLHRFHPDHRYNVAKTGLKPGYYDYDTIILHACMNQLCRYVEVTGEGADELERWSKSDEMQVSATEQAWDQLEAVAIYRWWKVERPADEKRLDELLMAGYSGDPIEWKSTENPRLSEIVFKPVAEEIERARTQHRTLEKKIEDDEQSYLHRLINIRQRLWD